MLIKTNIANYKMTNIKIQNVNNKLLENFI